MHIPRVLPLVIVAAALLLGLKTVSFVATGSTVAGEPAPPVTEAIPDAAYRPVVAANLSAVPVDSAGIDPHPAHDDNLVPPLDPATTGSVPPAPAAAGHDDKAAAAPETPVPPKTAPLAAAPDSPAGPDLAETPTEAKLLKELHDRQTALSEESRQVGLREALVKAAEKRLQQRLAALKALGVGSLPGRRDPQLDAKRMDTVVALYSGMRAKDAAVIFNRLDTSILQEIATRMKPRLFSDILGQMDPEAAERLTLALAGHGVDGSDAALDALPKIEGRPPAH